MKKYVVPEQAKVILKLQSETKKETKERRVERERPGNNRIIEDISQTL